MIRSTRYFSFATWQISMLSSSSPVTAITMSARDTPARSSTHSSDASPYWMLCSSSCSTVRYRPLSPSSSVTSWPLSSSSRARFQPTLPAPTMITYMRSLTYRMRGGLSHLARQHVDRHPRWADRVQALRLVPLRPVGIEDPRDHRRNLEAALGELRD